MAHPTYLKEKARKLRIERRMSLLEIAERLALPKTTVYYWIKDLPRPTIQHKKVNYKDSPARDRARKKAAQSLKSKYAALRRQAYEQGLEEYRELIGETGFRDFVCIYICEGYKRCRNRVSVGNSDPRVIGIVDHWIRRLARNRVIYRLQYHADQDPGALIEFWSEYLDADPRMFFHQRKSNGNQLSGRTWRSIYGVLTVQADDTMLRQRLQAWIDLLQQDWVDSLRSGV